MEPVRYGIIGLGQVSRKGHIPCLLRMPEAEIVAIADMDDDALQQAASQIGDVRAYRGAAGLLEDSQVEVVLVATPNWLHKEQTLAALAAGKHVFCEKPLGIDEAECKAILAAPSLPAFPEDPGVEILISRMLASVKQQEGVGIAAPQVGISRRVIVVQRQDLTEEPFVAYLNPRITSCSEDKVIDYEGCLSVPGWFGQVSRSAAITVSYVAPDGRTAVEEVKGWTARIFQHEIDHLNGVLFLDNREPGELIPEEEYRRLKEERKKQRRDQPTNANSPQA